MDRLAEMHNQAAPWPPFGSIDIAALRAQTGDELRAALDDAVPSLAERREPLLIEAVVEPNPDFDP